MTRYFPLARGFSIYSGFRTRDRPDHTGVDFGREGGSAGLPIYACQSGTVIYAGAASGYGGPDPAGWLVVDSTDAEGSGVTEYGHLVREVSVGDHVEAGQRIAHINPDSGSNGGVPPHCHLSVMPHGYDPASKIDPLPWLGQAAYPGEAAPMTTPAADLLFGVDISNHQGNIDIDQIAREGFTAVIAKASEGSTYIDPFFARNRDGARSNGLLFWGYHYLRSGDPVGNAACWDRAVGGDRSIRCMIDWESGGGGIGEVHAFKREVEALGYQVPVTYSGRWYWESVNSPGLDGIGALMDSNYGNNPDGYASAIYNQDGQRNWRSYGGVDATILQFTDHAQVAGQQIDAWAFRGTRDQLAALINGTPPVPQEDDMAQYADQLDRIEALLAVGIGRDTSADPPTYDGQPWGGSPRQIATATAMQVDAAVAQIGECSAKLDTILARPDAPTGDAPAVDVVAALREALATLTLKASN